MTVGATYKVSDGNAVTVGPLSASVSARQVAYANSWLGIAVRGMNSGEYVALNLRGEYSMEVPASLTANVGDIICIDTTQVTGHTPNDAAYNTNAASSTNLALMKVTQAKDASNIVVGILLLLGG